MKRERKLKKKKRKKKSENKDKSGDKMMQVKSALVSEKMSEQKSENDEYSLVKRNEFALGENNVDVEVLNVHNISYLSFHDIGIT